METTLSERTITLISREKYLLTVLAEECAEVAQRASKAIRFGLDEVQPGQELNNARRLTDELNDLMVVIHMLSQETSFNPYFPLEKQEDKRAKIEKFYQYSVSLGEAEARPE